MYISNSKFDNEKSDSTSIVTLLLATLIYALTILNYFGILNNLAYTLLKLLLIKPNDIKLLVGILATKSNMNHVEK